MTGLLESAAGKLSFVWTHDRSVRSFSRLRKSPAGLAFKATEKSDPDVRELLSTHCSWCVLDCGEAQAGRRKTPCRAGLYARVSTHDQQTLPLQSRAMREYAARRGWSIVVQVKEVASGASQRELREKVLDAARRREIDVVVVWRLDRWGRSVADLAAILFLQF